MMTMTPLVYLMTMPSYAPWFDVIIDVYLQAGLGALRQLVRPVNTLQPKENHRDHGQD
jgi:hypothetical protein